MIPEHQKKRPPPVEEYERHWQEVHRGRALGFLVFAVGVFVVLVLWVIGLGS